MHAGVTIATAAIALAAAVTPAAADGPSDLARQRERRRARDELVLWHATLGMMDGAALCGLGACPESRSTLLVVSSAVIGAGAAAWVFGQGVEEGEAHLYNSAATWGMAHAFAGFELATSSPARAELVLAGHLASYPVSYAIWHLWHPDEGTVALANSGGAWAAVLYGFAAMANNGEPRLADAVIAADVGIVAGALVASRWPMSRGRTLVIDSGAAIGVLSGLLVGVVGHIDSQRGMALALAGGTALGLGVAAVTSRHWGAPHAPATSLAPMGVVGPGGSTALGAGVLARF